MVDQTDTYTTRITIEAQQAIAELQALRQNIELYKQQIRDVQKISQESTKNIATAISRTAEFQLAPDTKALNLAVKELGTVSTETGGAISTLGSVGKFVFGTVLGIGAVQAVRAVIDVLKQAIQEGLKFQQTLFTFEVAVRGLQRMGMDTTLEEWRDLIESIKAQFPIFPREQITESVSLAALMTREFGFTADQIAEVVRMSAVLAELTGKDLHESVRGITYAIGSGYFESLQRVGINISRQIVAEEALRQGYEGSYVALDQNVRALITYNIIQKNLAAVQGDAGKIMETTAGQVRALTSAWKDLLSALGLVITENELVIKVIETVSKWIKTEADTIYFIKTLMDEGMNPTTAMGLNLLLDILIALHPELAGVKEELIGFRDILGDLEEPEKKEFVVRMEGARETQQEIQNIADELNKAIEDEEREAAERRKEIWIDYYNDLEQLAIDHGRRMADIAMDLQRELADIETSRTQDIEDENARYANELGEAAREAADRRAEAEREYRDRELIAELRFQERLRQLKEGFLYNLEDAVRERDARQIIRLTRQYNMEREQIIREEEIAKKERWLAYQRQLADIDRAKAERMSRLYAEHMERLREIDIQAERERQRAELEAERKREDELLRYEQDKADRETRYKDQLAQLDRQLQDRINEVAAKLFEEYKVTANRLDAIAAAYEATYGPGGRIDRAYRYYLSLIAAMSGGIPYGQGYGATPPPTDGNAEGGTKIVTKPTYELFGEAGPEAVSWTPLGRGGVNVGRTQGSVPAGMGGRAGNGKLLIQLNLDAGLQYQIVDQAMNELADVVMHIERARK